nr:hypothetical protein [Tanacetum cinerariifolium]
VTSVVAMYSSGNVESGGCGGGDGGVRYGGGVMTGGGGHER